MKRSRKEHIWGCWDGAALCEESSKNLVSLAALHLPTGAYSTGTRLAVERAVALPTLPMIRSKRINIPKLNAWLPQQAVSGSHPSYSLRLWRENPTAFKAVEGELKLYIEEAFADARQRLRRGFEDDLSPFNVAPLDPTVNYPAALHRNTLQGYFGETLGVLAVEHWGAHGRTDWQVPAFLFRFHDTEFQHLERINQKLRDGGNHAPDASTEMRPGRTGDDGLAFVKDSNGTITHVLTIEAKCIAVNNTGIVASAHAKLASAALLPDSTRELIEVLADYDTPLAQEWRTALLKFRSGGYRNATRFDSISYVCGNHPKTPPRTTWLDPAKPHPNYAISRHLEGMEFQVHNLKNLIDQLYRT